MIFQPQNVMGPAHRGNVIQQLAQGAAQNVMRRQRLKALLHGTAAQGRGAGGGQPIRSSLMGHSTGVRGATFRPGGLQPGGGGPNMLSPNPGGGNIPYPDPGSADLPSLPGNDPTQSPSSTQPETMHSPGAQYIDPATGQPAPGVTYNPYPNPNVPGTAPGSDGGVFHDTTGSVPPIPLGNGYFYDPATQSVTTGGGTRPGLQQ